MNSKNPASPYVGLRPFREEDFPFFFGRDREIRVIASNLQARPLTVLYGASGVGKSSVLQAGIVRRLKDRPGTSVLYFRDWQSASLLEEISSRAREFVSSPADAGTNATSTGSKKAVDPMRERVFLILDQFEEFLLYHASDNLGEEFCSILARIVNRKDCPANVLIGIRDDSLYKLDRRFSIRIPNLLRDTLEVERLSPAGARSAIEKPLKVFTENSGNGKVYGIEPSLVDRVLEQVQTGHVAISESLGLGARRNRQKENQIETAFLQLVLTKLWEEEQRRDSTTLRLRTLEELGGADNIVRSHVNTVMDQLASDRERDIAANMFRYLVTPSRSKIAQATGDLIAYAEKPEAEVKPVLDALTDRSESRILRRLSDPEQYEIFHDVLAQPLLDWRRAHEEALATKPLRRFLAGAGSVAVLLAILLAYALVERHRAHDAAELARTTSLKAELSEKEAQQSLAQLKADEAALAGHIAEAEKLRNAAAEYSKQAATITQSYQNQQQALDSTSKRAFDSIQAANSQRDEALQKLTAAQKERDDYRSQLEAAQQQIKELQKTTKPITGSPERAPVSSAPAAGKLSPRAAPADNTSSMSPPPSGLTADTSSEPAPPPPPPPTEVCARLTEDVSVATAINTPITAVISSPRRYKGYRMEGKMMGAEATVESYVKSEGKSVFLIQFDKIEHSKHSIANSVSLSVSITADLRSVTSSSKKAQLYVDEKGHIIGPLFASIPKDSMVCSIVTWPSWP